MSRFRSMARSIMGVFLVAIATLLVSCSSGGQAAAPTTYSASQLSQIASYAGRIQSSKERLPELASYIRDENWVNIENFTHGPLGELRTEMSRVAYQLLPADKTEALKLADEVSSSLESLSAAALSYDSLRANRAYGQFARNLSVFLKAIPTDEAS